MIYYTADHHFWHGNIIRYCARPFDDLDEMHAALIARHNDTVTDNDDVWMLGDIGFGVERTIGILRQLNGRLHLIVGNHDRKKLTYWPGWASVDTERVHDGVLLRHHPSVTWPGQNQIPLFHGHAHGTSEIPNAYDVGVDCWDFRPVSKAEVLNT